MNPKKKKLDDLLPWWKLSMIYADVCIHWKSNEVQRKKKTQAVEGSLPQEESNYSNPVSNQLKENVVNWFRQEKICFITQTWNFPVIA